MKLRPLPLVRTLCDNVQSKIRFRIAGYANNHVFIFLLDQRGFDAYVPPLPLQQFERDWQEGFVQEVSFSKRDDWHRVLDDEKVAAVKKVTTFIAMIEDNLPFSCSPRGIREIIAKALDAKLGSRRYLCYTATKFFEKGMVVYAVLPRADRTRSRQKPGTKKRGPKAIGPERESTFTWTETWDAKLLVTISQLKREGTIKRPGRVKDKFLDDNFRVDGALLSYNTRPSTSRILARAKLLTGVRSFRTLLTNESDFHRNLKAEVEEPFKGVVGAGSVYGIDCTIADIYVCLASGMRMIAGRPILYLVVDIYSRAIVGFHISLGNPCWIEAMAALHSAVLPKKELCEAWNFALAEHDWDMVGLCERLVHDGGKDVSKRLPSGLVNRQRISFTMCPSYSPALKGFVESPMNFIPATIEDKLPAWVGWRSFERGQKHPGLEADMTMERFAQTIIKAIIAWNNSVRMDYPAIPHHVAAGIPSIPSKIWELSRRTVQPIRTPDPLEAFIDMLPQWQVVVTNKGFKLFSHLYYTCPEAIEGNWFVDALSERWKLRCSYDPRLVNIIYIHSDDGRSPIKATLTPFYMRHYGNMTFARAMFFLREHRKLNLLVEPDREAQRSEARVHAGAAAKMAAQERAVAPADTRSKSQKTKNIRKTRAAAHGAKGPTQSPLYEAPNIPLDSGAQVLPFPASERSASSVPAASSKIKSQGKSLLDAILRGDGIV